MPKENPTQQRNHKTTSTRSESQKNAERKYNQTRSKRAKSWTVVAYPESLPENWLSLLRDSMVDCFVSPLHDKDVNPDGEVKKAHYHILFSFGSMKSLDQVKEICEGFGCTVHPQITKSYRNCARYLCHLDNPDKYQYPQSDVIEIGSCDYLASIGLPTDKYTMIGEMIEFCEINQMYLYSTLVRYSQKYRPDWFRCLCDNSTMVMKEYLKSAAYENGKHGGCIDVENLMTVEQYKQLQNEITCQESDSVAFDDDSEQVESQQNNEVETGETAQPNQDKPHVESDSVDTSNNNIKGDLYDEIE